MVFSSITFIFYFLPIVLVSTLLVHLTLKPFVSPQKRTVAINGILTLFSLVFYFWGEGFRAWILIVSILSTFGFSILIEGCNHRDQGAKATALAGLSVCVSLAMLVIFKYLNFGYGLVQATFGAFSSSQLNILTEIALPLGISFYTFQSISYTLDVYSQREKATRNLINFSCYITFFPQLVAGPIVRYGEIKSDLNDRKISTDNISAGISRFILGLGKKVLIANQAGQIADELFALPSGEISTLGAWIAAVSYGIQILYDFSGYSDMAIGIARIFGIKLPENFDKPYTAVSMRDFWRRWHMTLSRWFRDYLYIPLGGSRGKNSRTLFNLFIVFALCGFWHGAQWNFILWGLFHGVFLASEHVVKNWDLIKLPSVPVLARRTYVILAVLFSWVLFRAESLSDAALIYKSMLFLNGPIAEFSLPVAIYSTEFLLALLVGIFIALFRFDPSVSLKETPFYSISLKLVHFALFLLCVAYIAISSYNPFIYFRF